MANKETRAAIVATEEIDLTDYKLSKKNFQYANVSIAFEKNFVHNSIGKKMYSEYAEIIRNTTVYATTSNSIPHLIPVANFKINDIFGLNGGEPISCLAKVNAVYNTTPSKVAFVLEFYDFTRGNEEVEFENVRIIKDGTLYSNELRKLIK